jgi:predicted GTPase
MSDEPRRRIIILGAGGRDFHVFNTRYRHDHTTEVVGFTAAQIPSIDDRLYPAVLSGALYPDGIPIHPEDDLARVIGEGGIQEAVFAYSDVTHGHVEALSRIVSDAGAVLRTFDPIGTQLPVTTPCVAVCAVRTGCGKSGVSRHIAAALRSRGDRVGVLRHPMPYGQLERQVLQRFASIGDLAAHDCTIEEMEEYEPHIAEGGVVFAGADYLKILGAAESESDVILWDGGNNDTPFLRPDVWVTLLDPLRPGDETGYFPSRTNLEHADILLVAKTHQATQEQIDAVLAAAATHNPTAEVVMGASPYSVSEPELVAGKRVLVLEDGPTTTHGGMSYGAGLLAARAAGAAEIVDPRPHAVGDIAAAFAKYPHVHEILPALGYGEAQLADLERTIAATECDAVVVGTPIDLSRVINIDQPTVRASYEYADASERRLVDAVTERLHK